MPARLAQRRIRGVDRGHGGHADGFACIVFELGRLPGRQAHRRPGQVHRGRSGGREGLPDLAQQAPALIVEIVEMLRVADQREVEPPDLACWDRRLHHLGQKMARPFVALRSLGVEAGIRDDAKAAHLDQIGRPAEIGHAGGCLGAGGGFPCKRCLKTTGRCGCRHQAAGHGFQRSATGHRVLVIAHWSVLDSGVCRWLWLKGRPAIRSCGDPGVGAATEVSPMAARLALPILRECAELAVQVPWERRSVVSARCQAIACGPFSFH